MCLVVETSGPLNPPFSFSPSFTTSTFQLPFHHCQCPCPISFLSQSLTKVSTMELSNPCSSSLLHRLLRAPRKFMSVRWDLRLYPPAQNHSLVRSGSDLPLTLLPPTLCASYHFTSSLSADYLVLYLAEKTRGTLNFPYPASLRQTHPNRNSLVAFL